MAANSYDAWQSLMTWINDELIRHEAIITGGAIKTLEGYREELGFIRALRETASRARSIVSGE